MVPSKKEAMKKYPAIIILPLLRFHQQNERIRNLAEKMLRPFPGLKLYLQNRLLYASSPRALYVRTLHTGAEQQRICEELTRRLEAE